MWRGCTRIAALLRESERGVSAIGASGALNLSPYSFFNGIGDNPEMVMFSSFALSPRGSGAEDWFIPSRVSNVARLHTNSPPSSAKVRPPRVADAPAALECKWLQTIPLVPADGGEAAYFMAASPPSAGTSGMVWSHLHSRAAGASATRGGRTLREPPSNASGSRPSRWCRPMAARRPTSW
jgi:hypothetical protein